MINDELVTVIMPAYNAEKYIDETMHSIINQTYKNLEILIANDGSKDRTLEILKNYQQQDPRIVIDDHENMGISKTINRLTKMAKSEIVIRIDADDLMTLDRVEKQWRYFKDRPEIDFLSCDTEFINEKSEVFGYQSFEGYNTPEDSVNNLSTQSLVVVAQAGFATRKQAFLAVGGYDEDVIYAEDLDLFTRMVENGSKVIIMREPLVKYRLHANSAVASNKNLMRNQICVELIQENLIRRRSGQPTLKFAEFKQQLDAQPWLKKFHRRRVAMAFVSYRNAGALIGNKRYLTGIRMLILSFICNPIPFISKTFRHLKNLLKL
jgi:glycosyltransferase involved in cell wall biosynthesis